MWVSFWSKLIRNHNLSWNSSRHNRVRCFASFNIHRSSPIILLGSPRCCIRVKLRHFFFPFFWKNRLCHHSKFTIGSFSSCTALWPISHSYLVKVGMFITTIHIRSWTSCLQRQRLEQFWFTNSTKHILVRCNCSTNSLHCFAQLRSSLLSWNVVIIFIVVHAHQLWMRI